MKKFCFCYYMTASAVSVAIITTFIMVMALVQAKIQQAENQVIIEQLCHLDKTSYWCKKL